MSVCIIGGNGFLGSHITDALLAAGEGVRSFDRQPEAFRPPLGGVEYVAGDVTDPDAVRAAVKGARVVIHALTTTTPKTSNEKPVFDIETNLIPVVRMLDACVAEKVERVVYLSSGGTVYGVPQVSPIPETHPTNPICSYAVVKLAVEHYLGMYQTLHGLDHVSLRLSNPYGPRQNPNAAQGAVAVFAARALAGEPLTIWGDGSVVRDFIDVRDAARAVRAAALGPARNLTLNLGSGEGTSLNGIVAALEAALGRPVAVERTEGRSFDVPRSVLDIARALDSLDWTPRIDLGQGIADYLAWLRETEFVT